MNTSGHPAGTIRFKNTSDKQLNWSMDRRYTCPPGGEVEVPAHLEYAVVGRGLPLEKVGAEEAPPAWEEKPAAVSAKPKLKQS